MTRHLPDWQIVCTAVYPDDEVAAATLYAAVQKFAQDLDAGPELLGDGMDDIAPQVRRALALCGDIRNSLTREEPSDLEPN